MGTALLVVRFVKDGALMFGALGTVGELCNSSLELTPEEGFDVVDWRDCECINVEMVEAYTNMGFGHHWRASACRAHRVMRTARDLQQDTIDLGEGTPAWAKEWFDWKRRRDGNG